MTFDKGHKEFHTLDIQSGWQVPPGYPPGFQQKIIAGALDENSKRGNRTRLLRIAPGTFSTAPFVRDLTNSVTWLTSAPNVFPVSTNSGTSQGDRKSVV